MGTEEYDARLAEYRRKLQQQDNVSEDIKALVPGPCAEILAKAIPFITRYLPQIVSGLRVSAGQLETFGKGLGVVMNNPTPFPTGTTVPTTDTFQSRIEYGNHSDSDMLATKFGKNLALDFSPLLKGAKPTSEFVRPILSRWVEELKMYDVVDGAAKWPYRSVPEFIPDPIAPRSGEWIVNPVYQRLVSEGRGPGHTVVIPYVQETGKRTIAEESPDLEFSQEQIDEYLESANLEPFEPIDGENVRRYFEMKGKQE